MPDDDHARWLELMYRTFAVECGDPAFRIAPGPVETFERPSACVRVALMAPIIVATTTQTTATGKERWKPMQQKRALHVQTRSHIA